jgi:ribosomal protein L10
VLVADVRGFRANEMTDIRKLVGENAQFFLEKWYDYFDGEN